MKHGSRAERQSAEYKTWKGMWLRCSYSGVNGYSRYGGRGIKLCERWHDFPNFLADMGRKPSRNHSIDRINPRGNYEPSNCRWATRQEQCANRTSNNNLEFRGKIQHIAEWSRELRIKPQTIWMRLYRGWPIEKALGYPFNSNFGTKTPKLLSVPIKKTTP